MGISTSQKSAEQSAEAFTTAINQEKRSFDTLRASVDPAFAATRRYEAAVEAATRAERVGAVTRRESAQVIQLARKRYDVLETAMSNTVRTGRANTFVYRNLAQQINQVGQQGLVTGNYLQALSIQLPDILGAFGSLPLILAGGAAAIAAAFIPSMLAARDGGLDLEEQLDRLTEASDRFEASVQNQSRGLADLAADYGSMSLQAKRLFEIQAQIDQVTALRATSAARDSLSGSFGLTSAPGLGVGEIEQRFAVIDALQQRYDELYNTDIFDDEQMRRATIELEAYSDRIGQLSRLSGQIDILASSLDITAAAAEDIAVGFARMENAEGARAQATAMIDLADTIFEATEGLRDADDETANLYQQLLDAASAALSVAANAEAMADPIADAAEAAAQLKAELAAALALQNSLNRQDATQYGGRGDGMIEWEARRTGRTPDYQNELNYESPAEIVAAAQSAVSRNTVRGGASGGRSAVAQRAQNDLMREAERIYAATRTEAEKYAEALARADLLLENGRLTQDTYNRYLEQIGDQYDQNRDAADRFFDEVGFGNDVIIDSLMGQTDAWDAVSNSIKRAAYEYALFGEGPFGNLFGDSFGGLLGGAGGGFGGFLGSLLNFDGGGDTPNVARTGGVDGRGGFLTIMHGNERVTDLTKGGGAERTVIEVELSPDLIARQRQESTRIAMGISRAAAAETRAGLGGAVSELDERGTS